jgi:hypothetical protein
VKTTSQNCNISIGDELDFQFNSLLSPKDLF